MIMKRWESGIWIVHQRLGPDYIQIYPKGDGWRNWNAGECIAEFYWDLYTVQH